MTEQSFGRPEHDRRRRRAIRVLAVVLIALSLLIVVVSGYIRLKGAGLGCTPWPDCYASILSGGEPPRVAGARVLHRTVATLALLLGFLTLWRCMQPSWLDGPRRPATALLALMIVLTLVGVFSSNPQRAWAAFINILGGAGLVALATATYLASADTPPSTRRRPAALLHAGLGVLVLTLAAGALIGARYAAPACPGLPGCGAGPDPGLGLAALNPLTTVVGPMQFGDPGGALLHLLHRALAVASMILLGVGGVRALALPGARAAALILLAVLVAQLGLGLAILMSRFDLSFAVAHNLGAALLVGAGLVLLGRVRRSP